MDRPPNTRDEWIKAITTICGKQNHDWESEQEYRLAFPIQRLEDTGETDQRGYRIYCRTFPDAALVEIILGAKVSDDTRHIIQERLRESTLAHVNIRCAVFDTENYALTIGKCNEVIDRS